MPTAQYRRDRLMSLADLRSGTGLEIGALHSPIALRSECDVRYVDVFDSETLRFNYRDDPAVDKKEIVEVDFPLRNSEGSIRPLPEAVFAEGPYQWVLASHVVEHVPNLVKWLAEIAEVLVDVGTLVLAVPDRRYTFDVLRPQTTVGQILQSYYLEETTPSVRAVYDHCRSTVQVSTQALWAGASPSRIKLTSDLASVMASVDRAKDEYVDAHVWTFTPGSFVDQIVELGKLGLCDFVVENLIDTPINELEFYATLRRIPRGIDPDIEAKVRDLGIQSFEDTTPASHWAAA